MYYIIGTISAIGALIMHEDHQMSDHMIVVALICMVLGKLSDIQRSIDNKNKDI